MNFFKNHIVVKTFLLASLVATPVSAATDAEIHEAFKVALEASGVFGWGEPHDLIEVPLPVRENNRLTYKNIRVTPLNLPNYETTILGEVTLVGADINEQGGFKAEHIQLKNLKTGGHIVFVNYVLEIDSIEMINVDIGAPPIPTRYKPLWYDEEKIYNLKVKFFDDPFFTVSNSLTTHAERMENNYAKRISESSTGIIINLENTEFFDPLDIAIFINNPFSKIFMRSNSHYIWNELTKTYTIGLTVAVTAPEKITFDVHAELGEVAYSIFDDYTSMVQNENAGKIIEKHAKKVTLNEFSFGIDDYGFTNGILGILARKTGRDRVALTKEMQSFLSEWLIYLESPALAEGIVSALGTFLESPQNLTVRMKPPQKLSLDDIQRTVEENPVTLPERLGFEIRAHQSQ